MRIRSRRKEKTSGPLGKPYQMRV